MPLAKVSISARILSAFLILFVGGQTPVISQGLDPSSISAHPEPSRGTLRPEPARSGLEEALSTGLEEGIDEGKLFNQHPAFLEAVRYFNQEILPAPQITWDHAMELFRLYRGEKEDRALRRQRVRALSESKRGRRLMRMVNDRGLLWKATRGKAARRVTQIYRELGVNTRYDELLTFLEGFAAVLPTVPEEYDDSPHPSSGHNRLAWFLASYFLIRNGYEPLYFSSYGPLFKRSRPPYPVVLKNELHLRTPTRSGLEEKLQGEPDRERAIREKAEAVVEARRRARERRANSIGIDQVRRRLGKEGGVEAASVPPVPVPAVRQFPDFTFDKRLWVKVAEERAGELFEKGIVRIPMGKGQMILLLRGGRQVTTMMIDLLVRPDVNERRHVYLGRFDLNFSLVGGYWATSAKVSGEDKFDRIDAAHYLNENNIDQAGRFSLFEQSRVLADDKSPFYEALYADHDAAWNLGMKVDDVRNALALVAVEVTRTRDLSQKIFGADLRYPANTYFSGLGVRPVRVDFQTDAAWYPLDQIRWALRDRFTGRFRLNGQEWVSQIESQANNLRNRQKIEIPLEGGRAVLLLRAPHGIVALDLFLARDGELPRFAGRMDLTYGGWYYTAAGAASSAGSFSRDGALFLEASGINTASSGPIRRSRGEHSQQALWLDEKLLNEFRLEPSLVRDALIFSMLEVLVNANISQWGVDSRFPNGNLGYTRFPRLSAQENEKIFEMKLSGTQKTLQKALIQSSIRLDPEDWLELVEDEGWKLYVDGFLELPIRGGDILLFFRHSRNDQTLMFDMMLRQKYRGAHVYLASLDLGRDKNFVSYVAKGPGSWVPFSGTAEEYLESKRIPPVGESSLFEASRNDRRNRGALFLNSDVLDQGGLRSEIVQDAFLVAVLNVLGSLKKPGFGVHTGYDNGALIFLSLSASRSGEILLYDRPMLEEYVADRFKKSAAGLEENTLEELPRKSDVVQGIRDELGLKSVTIPEWHVSSALIETETPIFRVDAADPEAIPAGRPTAMLITHYASGRQWFHRQVTLTGYSYSELKGGRFISGERLSGLLNGRVLFHVLRSSGEVVYGLSAGLEEPAAAAGRVERSLKALLDHEHRGALRRQVIGPSILRSYPFLAALSYTRHLSVVIDPGGDQTEGIVRALADQAEVLRAGVDYYGNPDDVTNFLKHAARHGISFRENHRLAVNPNPAELLLRILSNMTDLTTYAVERRLSDLAGVSLEHLAQDLETLRGT